jgi:hypothetical protein
MIERVRGFFSSRKKAAATGAVVFGLLGTSVGGGITILAPQGDSDPGTANIWVGAAGTCADNASLVEYDPATSCGTLDAANDTCDNGDTVRVKDGSTYSDQTISGSNSRTSDCLLKPEIDGDSIAIDGTVAVSAGRLSMTSMHQTIDTPGYMNYLSITGTNLTFTDHKATRFETNAGANTVLISDSDFGPCIADQEEANNGVCNNRVVDTATNITVQDSLLHGNGQRCQSGLVDCGNPINIPHSECIAIFGGSSVAFYRNKIYECGDTASILMQSSGGGNNPTDYTWIGNWISLSYNDLDGTFTSSDCNAFEITLSALRGAWVFAFNSMYPCMELPWIGTSNAVNITSSRIVGNLGVNEANGPGGCPTGMTADYNVYVPFSEFTGQTACGTNQQKVTSADLTSAYTTVSGHSDLDFHLTTNNPVVFPAANLIPTSVAGGCPATDIDGQSRPIDSNCDAGSDER